MSQAFRDVIKEEKYLLPAVNWMLIVVISSTLATIFGGWELGAMTAVVSSLITTPLKEWAPSFYQYIKDMIKGWDVFTHTGIFIVLASILIWLAIDFYKERKSSQTISI